MLLIYCITFMTASVVDALLSGGAPYIRAAIWMDLVNVEQGLLSCLKEARLLSPRR